MHVLGAEQKSLAEQFASKGVDRWAGVLHQPGQTGVPLLDGAVAAFECFNRSRYQEGDHVIFVGEVEHCSHRHDAAPLLYHAGKMK
ncbi:p-hydroxyphenylacetate 3-hydroxylase, reductase component [compost metagenome]